MPGKARVGLTTLLALTCLMAVTSVPISLGREQLYDTVLYPVNAIALGVAGALVAAHQRANPIGWVLCGQGVEAAFVELTEGYGYHAEWPWAPIVEWVTNWASFVGIGMVAIVLTLFPSGRDLSPGRRALVGTGVLATALMTVGAAFSHASDPSFATGTNPYAVAGWEPVDVAGQVLFTIALLGAIGSLVLRYRRSTGIERQQLKWVAYVVGLLAVIGPIAIFAYDDSVLVQVAIAVVITALPAAICIAILRYRLYDIDVIINRTVVYGATTALLAVAYLTVALAGGALLGGSSPWVTAAATLLVAVAFRPVRSRIQDGVDRRFRRARHAALARVDAFLDDLRAGRVDPEELEPLLRELVGQPGLELRYIAPGEVPSVDGGRVVERAGTPLAVVRAEAADGDPHRLDEILDRAGLAIEIARLRAEVRRQLAEVEASRARIVAAGYEERRRLERDLHDGAQQRLVSVGLMLRHAQFEVGDGPVVATIDQAVEQITVAIADLRGLAGGIRPACLDEGLDVALQELAGRAPLPVAVDTGPDRYPADIEATAYFVACEALTNAVKHSAATGIELHTEAVDGHLVVTVRDNGTGGAHAARGTGLRGLSDRVAAVGGRLRIDSRHGGGTTLIAELPCGS